MWNVPVYATALTESSAAAGSPNRKAMKLYISAAAQDFQWKKVLIASRLVGVPLESLILKEDEFESLLPNARSCVLVTKDGSLTQTSTILRYLAELRPDLTLSGATGFEQAMVNQWLEFCWFELEVLVGALTIRPDESEGTFDPASIRQILSRDAARALECLNKHLASHTFMVGNGITLAEAALVPTLVEVLSKMLMPGDARLYPHVLRWFKTLAHGNADFAAVLQVPTDFKPLAPLKPSKVAVLKSPPPASKTAAPGSAKASSPASSKPAASPGGLSAGNVKDPFPMKFKRTRTRVKDLLKRGAQAVGEIITVCGWAQTVRAANKGKILFVVITDGSCTQALQCVIDSNIPGFAEASNCGGTGASFSLLGKVVESPGAGQSVELVVQSAEVLGKVYGGDNGEVGGKYYPLSKKGHSAEHLRDHAHLRPRVRSYAATHRVRNTMAFATHKFFFERGFQYVHTPLITASDCEGAGEMFAVTTQLPKDHSKKGKIDVDYSKDFFGKPAGLTVSGQLNVETHACGLSDCYTFGPTFRAEDSHTSRHLAEFWMIEPEICFADLKDDADLAEDYLKFCVHSALTECGDELELLEKIPNGDSMLRERLQGIVEKPFARKTYTECIKILLAEVAKGAVKFEESVEWGMDMGSEHERYLAEKFVKGPLIVTNYPKGIKAFYMKLDEDGKTVSAMDILVPRIGEIIGGSVREDRYDVLVERAKEVGIDPKDLSWYLDLRKYGSVPHAGFGLGFERLIMLVTGLENIRDVIPFPRYPQHCTF